MLTFLAILGIVVLAVILFALGGLGLLWVVFNGLLGEGSKDSFSGSGTSGGDSSGGGFGGGSSGGGGSSSDW